MVECLFEQVIRGTLWPIQRLKIGSECTVATCSRDRSHEHLQHSILQRIARCLGSGQGQLICSAEFFSSSLHRPVWTEKDVHLGLETAGTIGYML